MTRVGEEIPDIELRSDEGTPILLADLAGRDTVVFLLGKSFCATAERLLSVLSENIERFLSLEFSPVVVIGEKVPELANYRKHNDVPFLLLSDESCKLHEALHKEHGQSISVWIVSSEGHVIDAVPAMPPTELVNMALDRITRFRGKHKSCE